MADGSRGRTDLEAGAGGDQVDLLEEMWRLNSDRLLRGDALLDPLIGRPEDDGRRCLTLLARVPITLHAPLLAIQARLQAASENYAYPAASFHFTIRGIYDYGAYTRVEKDIAAIGATLAKLTSRLPPLRIRFRGVNVNRSAAFIQGLYDDDHVQRLRRAMGEALARFGVAPLPTLDVPVDFVWVNLVRFARRDLAPLVAEVERLREADCGGVEIRGLELSEIDKVFSPHTTVTFRHFSLL